MASRRVLSCFFKSSSSNSKAHFFKVQEVECGMKSGMRRMSTEAPHPSSLRKPDSSRSRYGPYSWKGFGLSLLAGGGVVAYLWYLQAEKDAELAKQKRRTLGKSLIGGPWKLRNAQTGALESEQTYLGQWTLIYFGFTHCPDICPDELNKMIKVNNLVESDRSTPQPIVPLFFTVDPDRDTAEAVRKYCQEFSPKLVGYVGSKEEVEKVTRTFRVYYSQGPKDEFNDYIVDHTVIMYLIDPTGQFVDYYGQNRTAEEISEAIQLQMIKYYKGKKKGWW